MKQVFIKIASVLIGIIFLIKPAWAQESSLLPRPVMHDSEHPAPRAELLRPRPLLDSTTQEKQIQNPVPRRKTPVPPIQSAELQPDRVDTPPARGAAILAVRAEITTPITSAATIQTIAAQMTPEQRTHADNIRAEIQSLNQIQEEIKNSGSNADVLEQAQAMQNKMQILKNELRELRRTKYPQDTATPNARFEHAGTSTVSSTPPALDTELTKLERSIELRDALIEQLITELKSDTHESAGSELSASITAVSDHPVAASGIAIFAITLLWLFRGRIAEFSGFGIKVSFKDGEKKEE